MQITTTLHKAARVYPDRAATVFADRTRSFSELVHRVSCLAAGLRSLGVTSGSRVAMLSPNSDKLFEATLATLWVGGVAVPLNTRWSELEIAATLADSGATVLFLSEHFSDMANLKSVMEPLPLRLVRFHSGNGDCELEALISEYSPLEDTQSHGDDLAFILYTGGTTGRPKGVMVSHSGLITAAVSVSAGGCGTQGQIYLHVAPLFHMADVQFMVNHLLNMGTHAFLPVFDPVATQEFIERAQVSDVLLVPTMIQALISHPTLDVHKLSSLQTIIYGAAPMTPALLERAMQALPQCQFIQGYGMTETGLAAMLPARFHIPGASGKDLERMSSAGFELPLAEVRIVDPAGYEVPSGEVGEIQIRSPSLMQGYWKNEEKTASALTDGWMHTEDLAYRDSDGFIYIVDRLKDMIITGGENVYSSEVENVISRHEAVAQCAVIGVPDEKWGERVHAEVVLKKGQQLSEKALLAFCRDQLSSFKCPRSFSFSEALPLSPAGKILKTEIRKLYSGGDFQVVR